jgi:hypothetical protein
MRADNLVKENEQSRVSSERFSELENEYYC